MWMEKVELNHPYTAMQRRLACFTRHEVETTRVGLYRGIIGYIFGIMEKKMETTIMVLTMHTFVLADAFRHTVVI